MVVVEAMVVVERRAPLEMPDPKVTDLQAALG